MTPWRNGSASDSRSEGCVFESRRGQHFPFVSFFLFIFAHTIPYFSRQKSKPVPNLINGRKIYKYRNLQGVPSSFAQISCTITFEQNFIFTSVKISKQCLLLYRVLLYRSSVTGMPPLFGCLFLLCFVCFVLFFCGISHTATVEAQMIHFDSFYHLSGTQEPFRPQTISVFRLSS